MHAGRPGRGALWAARHQLEDLAPASGDGRRLADERGAAVEDARPAGAGGPPGNRPVIAAQQRAAVTHATAIAAVGEGRACRATGVPRATPRSRRDSQRARTDRPHWGYRRRHLLVEGARRASDSSATAAHSDASQERVAMAPGLGSRATLDPGVPGEVRRTLSERLAWEDQLALREPCMRPFPDYRRPRVPPRSEQ